MPNTALWLSHRLLHLVLITILWDMLGYFFKIRKLTCWKFKLLTQSDNGWQVIKVGFKSRWSKILSPCSQTQYYSVHFSKSILNNKKYGTIQSEMTIWHKTQKEKYLFIGLKWELKYYSSKVTMKRVKSLSSMVAEAIYNECI